MFDFEKGDWSDGMRITYKMTKWLIAEMAFQYCGSMYKSIQLASNHPNHIDGWKGYAIEYVWAYEQCEGTFSLPIEQLMFEVAIVIFYSGRSNENGHRSKINEILKDRDLALMLKDIPQAEKNEFEHDLKLLGLME